MSQKQQPKWVYCIEGEVEIGIEKAIIEEVVGKDERYTAAPSIEVARDIFADRFSKRFCNRFYLADARIFMVRQVRTANPQPPQKTAQTAFKF